MESICFEQVKCEDPFCFAALVPFPVPVREDRKNQNKELRTIKHNLEKENRL